MPYSNIFCILVLLLSSGCNRESKPGSKSNLKKDQWGGPVDEYGDSIVHSVPVSDSYTPELISYIKSMAAAESDMDFLAIYQKFLAQYPEYFEVQGDLRYIFFTLQYNVDEKRQREAWEVDAAAQLLALLLRVQALPMEEPYKTPRSTMIRAYADHDFSQNPKWEKIKLEEAIHKLSIYTTETHE